MDVGEQTKLRFYGVDFIKVAFSAMKPAEDFADSKIDLAIEPRVFYPKAEPNSFKILTEIKVKRADFFELEILALAHFELSHELSKEQKKQFVDKNAVAILFPYIRSFITTLSASLGNVTGPIVLPIHFFNGEMDEIPEAPPSEQPTINNPSENEKTVMQSKD